MMRVVSIVFKDGNSYRRLWMVDGQVHMLSLMGHIWSDALLPIGDCRKALRVLYRELGESEEDGQYDTLPNVNTLRLRVLKLNGKHGGYFCSPFALRETLYRIVKILSTPDGNSDALRNALDSFFSRGTMWRTLDEAAVKEYLDYEAVEYERKIEELITKQPDASRMVGFKAKRSDLQPVVDALEQVKRARVVPPLVPVSAVAE